MASDIKIVLGKYENVTVDFVRAIQCRALLVQVVFRTFPLSFEKLS